jgi:hypothetical protein
MGVPSVDGVISTAASPSSDTEPRVAVEPVVTRGCISLEISKVTSTRSPANAIPVTVPTGTPAIRTWDPSFSPAMLVNTVFSA